jgi:hypothetical protein
MGISCEDMSCLVTRDKLRGQEGDVQWFVAFNNSGDLRAVLADTELNNTAVAFKLCVSCVKNEVCTAVMMILMLFWVLS